MVPYCEHYVDAFVQRLQTFFVLFVTFLNSQTFSHLHHTWQAVWRLRFVSRLSKGHTGHTW